MNNSNHSLKSLAASLNEIHSHQQKPNIPVTFKNNNPADRLRPGRHRCECQARIHKLIRNCLSCGRVVCEQEGSGPCMFCGELVCTREERKILNQKSRKSIELYNRLMGCGNDKTLDAEVFSLASVGNALAKAEQYKNKLLVADSETEMRTHIHDLESDYYNMENNIYLTKEERQAIVARKEELKELRKRQRRILTVDFDFENANVSETKENQQDVHDPVIESILLSSRKRQQAEASKPEVRWAPDGFVLKYNSKNQRRNNHRQDDNDEGDMEDIAFMMLSDEMMYMEVARKGYTIGIVQPIATLLAYGFRRHLPWNEDVDIRGPILIASKSKSASKNEIEKEISHCSHFLPNNSMKEHEFPSEFPSGMIVGRALLTDCLSMEEYKEKYSNNECSDAEGSCVLIFDVFEPLLIPIPHIPLSDGIYQVDKQLLTVIKQILEPASFY
ncbi:Activating signal cointegrator [Dirofilaria immitis]|nr:Activating signal cointegrator 1 [Dirofilaria immitis]